MNESTTKRLPAAGPVTETGRHPEASADESVRDPRRELIQKFQSDAMQRQDALSANLGMINGDLMLMAYRLRQSIEKTMAKTDAATDRQFAQQAETYLKYVRQIDRLAQIDRQLQKETMPET